MAEVTTHKERKQQVPIGVQETQWYKRTIPISATEADNGDTIAVADIAEAEFVSAKLDVSGTLGASCTLQLRSGNTALTPATTAGGASYVDMNVAPHEVGETAETLNLLVGGADISAAATAKIWVELRNTGR